MKKMLKIKIQSAQIRCAVKEGVKVSNVLNDTNNKSGISTAVKLGWLDVVK